MKKIMSIIYNHPIWVMLFVFILLVVSILGITGINVETGNQTLVKDDSETFINNDAYQSQFGGETIILHLEANNELLDLETIQLFNDLESDLSFQDGVFSYQSPSTIVKSISSTQYEQFRLGISEIGTGLKTISDMFALQASALNGLDSESIKTAVDDLDTAFSNLENGQTNLANSLDSLETGLDSVKDVLIQLVADLTNDGEVGYASQLNGVNTKINQLLGILSQVQEVPIQANSALDAMNTQLSGLFTQLLTELDKMDSFVGQLSVLSQNLNTMSETLLMIESYSDSFYAGIPRTEKTLNQMIYEDDIRRPMFDVFVIDETYVMMQVTLNGDITKKDKQAVVDVIKNRILDSEFDGEYLLSGKAVLDLSIQNSMVSSMQKMLMLSIGLMIIILIVTFKVKWRILPLITVLLAVIMTIGIMGYLSIPITMVSMAVFPILIGLGIDYAIQFQNRYSLALEEENSHE
ncbi:MAG: MMPL family transporter [Tenericutes bacterium]|jgi:predicted RND superfamily exporter protein|nr:MMPL family transporter [Mycoplasmatota bacterium]